LLGQTSVAAVMAIGLFGCPRTLGAVHAFLGDLGGPSVSIGSRQPPIAVPEPRSLSLARRTIGSYELRKDAPADRGGLDTVVRAADV